MARQLTPDELRGLLGAHALDALERDERAQVERLLLNDPDARAELHALQLGAAWLRRSTLRPPRAVWDRIAAEVRHDVSASVVAERIRRRAERRRQVRLPAFVAATVAVAMGASAALVTVLDQGQSRQERVAAAAAAAAGSPEARIMRLRAPDGRRLVDAVVLPSGRGYVLSAKLASLRGDRTYQLWALTPSGPVSAGLLGRSPAVQAFRVPDATTGMAITSEPGGGSAAPTGTPVATA